MFIWAGYTCFQACLFIILFNPTYRRMEAEKVIKSEDVQDMELSTAEEGDIE